MNYRATLLTYDFKALGVTAPPFDALPFLSKSEYDSVNLVYLEWFSDLNPPPNKYWFNGAVANMHYRIEAMKQVLPILFRPTGL